MLKDKSFLLVLVFFILNLESCVTPKDKTSSSKPIVTKFVLDEEPSYQSKYENKFIQEQIWGFYDNEIRFSTGVIVPQETGGIKDYLFYKQNGINNCLAVMRMYGKGKSHLNTIEINNSCVVGSKVKIYFDSVDNSEMNRILYFWTPGEEGIDLSLGQTEITLKTDKGSCTFNILKGTKKIEIEDGTNSGRGSLEFVDLQGLDLLPCLEEATATWFVNSGEDKKILLYEKNKKLE